MGLLMPTLASAAVHGLPSRRLGVGSAVNQAIRQIGFVLGVAVTVAVVGNTHGPDALAAFRPMFLLLALGGFLTALLSVPIDTRIVPAPSEVLLKQERFEISGEGSSLGAAR